MKDLVRFLVELRERRGFTQASLARKIAAVRQAAGVGGTAVTRHLVWRWEHGETEVGADDASDWLTAIGASREEKLAAVDLAGSRPPRTDPDDLPPEPCADDDLHVDDTDELGEAPPDVGPCDHTKNCDGRLAPVTDGDFWVASWCGECQTERDVRRRPVSEIAGVVEAARRKGAA